MRRILPDRDTLYFLYWKRGLSTVDIARRYGVANDTVVQSAMVRDGIPRRRAVRVGRKLCIVCRQPVVKKFHKKLGRWYGRRCELHQDEFDQSFKRKQVQGD